MPPAPPGAGSVAAAADALVMHAGAVLTMTGPATMPGAVLVADGRVRAAGHPATVTGHVDAAGAAVLDLGPATVVLPGLVNAHAHLEYGPSFADLATSGVEFASWLRTLTGRRQQLGPADWARDAAASAAALLATGTTCVADVVTVGPGIAAAGAAGLAGVSYVEAVGADDAVWAQREAARVRALLDADPAGRTLGLSPHTVYTLGTAVLRAVLALARERGLRLHPHLAESAAESAYVQAGTGPFAAAWERLGLAMELVRDGGAGLSPTAYLAAHDGLGPDVHVAHGVHLDAADRARLRAAGTAVALCPRSNAVLQAGEAPVAAYRAEGSPVALGTDSLSSCPDLDLLAEARALAVLARAQGSPEPGLAGWCLRAATTGGAAALGLSGVVGVLAPGARGDVAAVTLDRPAAALPPGQVAAAVLGGRARTVLLGGRTV